MGRRIEVELTSTREDGSWTWRAAGAKQPKGDVMASLLYDGAKVGDVVKVEAEFHLDGIEVTEVFAPKAKKERTDLLELKSRPLRDDELVTTQRVAGGRRSDRDGGRGRRDRRGDRGDRGDRGRGDRGDRGDRARGERRGPRPEPDRRPKPKRLRPKRAHRDAMLESVTEEHRPIVEQVIRDGMPGVRAAIDKQNAEAKEAGKPPIDAAPILKIAEQNLSRARLAEWRDRADAALADAAELDIRDLRSVVVAGADVARDDESRAVADQIKSVLDERLESDHAAWLADLDAAVSEGRVVRGLRLSSRPVKAGAPLPTEIATKLSQQAAEALAPDVSQDRWATVLDALAFSPVRGAVTPIGLPAEPGEELLAEVRRLSDRIPAIANLFGIDPAQVPKSAKRRRSPRSNQRGRGDAPGRGGRAGDDRKPKDPSATRPGGRPVPGAEKAQPEKPSADQPEPTADETPAEQPAAEAPAASDAPAQQAEPEAPAIEEPQPEPTEADQPEAPAAEQPEAETGAEPEADQPAAQADQPQPEPTEAEATAEPEPTPEPETDQPAAEAEQPDAETGAEPEADQPNADRPEAAQAAAEAPAAEHPQAEPTEAEPTTEPETAQSAAEATAAEQPDAEADEPEAEAAADEPEAAAATEPEPRPHEPEAEAAAATEPSQPPSPRPTSPPPRRQRPNRPRPRPRPRPAPMSRRRPTGRQATRRTPAPRATASGSPAEGSAGPPAGRPVRAPRGCGGSPPGRPPAGTDRAGPGTPRPHPRRRRRRWAEYRAATGPGRPRRGSP